MPMRVLPHCVLLACATALAAADEAPGGKLDPVAVHKLVEQLVSEDFATRQRAMQELSKLEEAPDALREATKSNDPELRRRAQRVVDVITTRAENKAFAALVQWTRTEDFNSNRPHDPLVVRDKVIVGTEKGQLLAYRCKDGNSVWVHQHGARIYPRPCSDGQRVYFSSEKGLRAVNVDDGAEVWGFGLPCCDGPSLVLDKPAMVFVGGNDGMLYALDAKTGKQLWGSDFPR
jgi:PAS domain-containing protein